ncbi:MAG: hypothetical protein OEL79_04305 [Chromatiales bacterium]|nr:hypothetical protein [Chromatiales bacterium]
MRALKIILLVTATATLFGCQVTRMTIKSPGYIHTPGPAYGYYKKHPRQHRWDDDLGLYIFLESPDTYYDNNYYFRWSIELNDWERADEPNGRWHRIEERRVPSKLIKKRHHKHGPAKHAPAYGYYKKHTRQHRWDDNLGLYIFLESPDTYYDNNYYFRWSTRLNNWERADEPRGNWQQIRERDVPSRLIKRRPKVNHRQMNQRDDRNNRRDPRQELERETERERYSNRRENSNDKKERKQGRQNKKRERYEEDCQDNGRGRSGKCRD